MKKRELSLGRFSELLEAYGSRIDAWPAREAAGARALLESSAEARALLDAEAAFEGELRGAGVSELPAGLERRLLEIPVSAKRRNVWPFGSMWLPALGWAAAAAFGLWIGASSGADDEEAQALREESELIALSTGAFTEIEELP